MADKEEPKEPELTDEILKRVEEDPEEIGNLDPGLQARVHEHLLSRASEKDSPEDSPKEEAKEEEPSGEKAAKEEKPKEEAEKKDPSEEKPATTPVGETGKKPKRESKAKKYADKANKWEQTAKSLQKKLDEAKKKLDDKLAEEVKVDDPKEPFADDFAEYQKAQAERTARLEKQIEFLNEQLEQNSRERLEEAQTEAEQAKAQGIFAEIEELQEDFESSLKTSASFKDLNDSYAGFLKRLVTHAKLAEADENADEATLQQRAAEKWESDPGFKKNAQGAGIDLPKALQDEWEKYSLISQVHQRKSEKGGSLRANWLEYLDETGKLEDALSEKVKEASVNASKKTMEAMDTTKEPKQLNPSDGPGANDYLKEPESLEAKEQRLEKLQKKLESGGKFNEKEELELEELIKSLSPSEKK